MTDLIAALPHPALVVDEQAVVRSANDAFVRNFARTTSNISVSLLNEACPSLHALILMRIDFNGIVDLEWENSDLTGLVRIHWYGSLATVQIEVTNNEWASPSSRFTAKRHSIIHCFAPGEITFANRSVYEHLQYQRFALPGTSLSHIVDPKYLVGLVDTDQTRLTGRMELLRADGSSLPIEYVKVSNEFGTFILFETVRREVLFENEISHKNTLLHAYINSTRESMIILDRKFRISAFNKMAWETIYAIHKKSVAVGDSILDYAEPSTKDSFVASYMLALEGQETKVEVRVPFSGYDHWWSVSYIPIIADNGEIVGVSFVSLNISERKKIEFDLLEAKERIRRISENIPNGGIFRVVQKKGETARYDWISSGIAKILGRPAVDFHEGRVTLYDLMHELDLARFRTMEEKARVASLPIDTDVRVRVGSAYRWIYVSVQPYYVGDTLFWDGLLLDVDHQRGLYERLQRNYDQQATLIQNIHKGVVFQLTCNSENKLSGKFFSTQPGVALGFRSEELSPDPVKFFQQVHPADRVLLDGMLAFHTDGPMTLELSFRYTGSRAIGHRWLHLRGRAIRNQEGALVWDGIIFDIHDAKTANDEVRLNEQRLRELFERMGVGLIRVDSKGRINIANAKAAIILSIDTHDLINKSCHELTDLSIVSHDEHVIDSSFFFDLLVKYADASGEFKFRLRRKGQTDKWILLSLAPVYGSNRQREYIVLSFIDITNQVENERQLERTKKQLESLLNTQSSFLVRTDLQGNYTYVNGAFCRTFNFTPEELIGMNAMETVVSSDHGMCYQTTIKAIENPGQVVRVTLRKPHPTKGIVVTDWEFMCLTDNQGVPSEIQCVGLDVTDSREAVRLLALSEAKLASIINNTNDLVVWSVDRMNTLIAVNSTFSEFWHGATGRKLSLGDTLDFSTLSNSADDIQDTWTGLYQKVFEGGTMHTEGTLGSRVYEYVLNPIVEDGFIVGASVVGNDITDRIQRAHELGELNKKIGEMKLAALRTAMNPHFVFNALNSIQAFITTNDRLNAINYLSKFSKLMRGVLTSSIQAKVRLAEELELLRYYIQIEELRFGNKFSWQIDVDKEVDTDSVEIPPLLLQPYVENAILHGLNNKRDKGNLDIRISRQSGAITVTIDDDGVGFEEAQAIKQRNFPAHQSMGTNITEERLRLLSEHDQYTVEIVDKCKIDGLSGTRVILRLGIEE